MNALVDTNVWSLALRRKAQHQLTAQEQSAVRELNELVKEGRARIIGVVRQELLTGIRTSEQFEKLRNRLRAFPDEPLLTEDFESAAEANNKCRAHGIAVAPIDLLICATAVNRGWTVFTNDPDFGRCSPILSLKLHASRGHS